MRYLNIDFFTLPIRGSSLTVILLPTALGLLGVGCILCHCRKKPVSTPNPLLRFYDRVLGIRDRLFHGRGLFRAELCKLLWHQRGAAILLLLLGWAIWLSNAPPIDWGSYDATAAYYRGQYEGPVSTETLSWIDEALNGMTVTGGDEAGALRYQALLTVREEAEELLARSEESGTALWLLNTTLYDALMNANINGYQRETGLTAVLFVVLLLAGSLAYENQQRVKKLLRCTKRGGGALWRRKAACALLLTTLVWLAVYGTEMLRAVDTYGGFHALSAPVQSLGPMTALPGSLSIGGWLAFMYLTRLLVLWLCAFAVLLVSGLCAGVNLAMVVCAAVFLLPGALGLMGSEVTESFSFTRPLSVAECVGSPLVFYLPFAAVGIGAYGAGRILWLKRR